MVHLLPGNWDQWHDGEEVEVWVNTNQPSAELFLNGESLSKKSFDEKRRLMARNNMKHQKNAWDDKTWGDSTQPWRVTHQQQAVLDDGRVKFRKTAPDLESSVSGGYTGSKAYDKNGKVVATDGVSTSSTPYTISAVADKTVLKARRNQPFLCKNVP